MVFDAFFTATLGEVLTLPGPWGLAAVSFILTTLITLSYKLLTDQNMMKSLKQELKDMQKEIKEAADDTEKRMSLQKTMLEKNMTYMKHSMKPMLITFLPIIIVFGWLRGYYTALGEPKVFLGLSWLWSYLIFSIVFSMLVRKVMKVH